MNDLALFYLPIRICVLTSVNYTFPQDLLKEFFFLVRLPSDLIAHFMSEKVQSRKVIASNTWAKEKQDS